MTEVRWPTTAAIGDFDVYANTRQVEQRLATDRRRLTDVLELVRASGARTILELGAPPFLLTGAMAHAGLEVTANGLPVAELPQRSTVELVVRDVTYSLPFMMFDVEQPFPLEAGTFDAVVAGELFEHLNRAPWAMLAEVWRVLKPGGHVVLTTPNGLALERGYAWLKRASTGLGFHPDAPTLRHAREYSSAELRAILASQGFTVDSIRSVNYSVVTEGFPGAFGAAKRAIYTWLKRRAQEPGGIIGDRGDTLVVSATKAHAPGPPPDFMTYALGDPRTGYNFEPV
jgi:2-polyprenyl-3-methyl-5-hydroxy-6-metoxy-1,4-benzoquinol methylase